MLQPYQNLAGNSGVIAYEAGPRSILVQFVNGDTYRYTYESAGAEHVEEMKRLAANGRGLSTFISRVARDLFATKS